MLNKLRDGVLARMVVFFDDNHLGVLAYLVEKLRDLLA